MSKDPTQKDDKGDELTEEEEAGILVSLAELDAGRGISLNDAIETIRSGN